jgi:hypothetical protein
MSTTQPNILIIQADQLAANYLRHHGYQTCLRADRIYSQWAYGGRLGYHVPGQS